MLRVALKLLVYLSILTSTRTSSSYLESQPLVNFRRSGVSANPQQQQKQHIQIETDQQVNERPYFIPRLVNANKNMLFTQLSNTQLRNNRRASKKSRKNKKEQQQQFYESHIKRKSSFNEDARPNEEEEQIIDEQIVNHSNTTLNQTNEYPSAQIDEKHERELQEVFGIEGARKYQEYQLKQQILNQQHSADVKDLPQKKRDSSLGAAEEIQDVPGSMINQMMSRTTRGQRVYDVPLIQCPPATDGMERFACPSPDRQGRYRCIDDHVLCDGFIDCPEGADEDRQACMFYKTTKAHLDVLADALLRWARGR